MAKYSTIAKINKIDLINIQLKFNPPFPSSCFHYDQSPNHSHQKQDKSLIDPNYRSYRSTLVNIEYLRLTSNCLTVLLPVNGPENSLTLSLLA